MAWLSRELSPATCVNLMNQYRPGALAFYHPPLDRPLSPVEFRQARREAEAAGVTRCDERGPGHQEHRSARLAAGRDRARRLQKGNASRPGRLEAPLPLG
ncbi:hypothetical protein NNJEOMEG_03143 [Fundidesulfovibrio magnetotacticus]|uniref:Uncharacterized protein n=1 Tax=Fundidesulfovibrio magnetotacticus TaxID=2730080 RepID=A0A6V8LU82_9BACT|nr:hypothetical protein [Fundidesulfovibrio magnetotacticus]GFK95284.1 hypothetical protein NNJEOMEG_03143 [Fundidesulfovibrio magnetotacticus]